MQVRRALRSTGVLTRIFIGALALAALSSFAATAQNYPNKVITLIVPSSPGGPADVAARLIVDRMSAILGQQIIIETVPGAGGTIGMGRVARAAPDGYTLLIHQNGFAITPWLYEKLTFNTAKDFATVGLVNRAYTIFVGRKDLPANNFAELVAWMKGPGKPAKVAHPGKGTNGHLQTVMFVRAIGAEATLVPYRGIAPAINDLLGGHVDVSQVASNVAAPNIRAGNMKAFATTAPDKDPAMPDLPSIAALGYKDLAQPFWHALFAPAGTPKPIMDRLNAALRETLADPKVQQLYADGGVQAFPPDQLSLEASDAYVHQQIDFWGKVVRENDVKLD